MPEPPPTPAERLEVAFESHKKSRAERITARELQAKVRRPRVLRGADVCECECIWAGASFKCGMLAGATLGLTQRSETRLLVSVAEHGVVGTVLVCSRRKRHAARTLSASPPTLSASRPTHAHAQK